MKKMYIIIGALALIIILVILGLKKNLFKDKEDITGSNIYKNDTYNYSIKLPQNWEAKDLTTSEQSWANNTKGENTSGQGYHNLVNFIGFKPKGQIVTYQHAIFIVKILPTDASPSLDPISDIINHQNHSNSSLILRSDQIQDARVAVAGQPAVKLTFANNADKTNTFTYYVVNKNKLTYVIYIHNGEPLQQAGDSILNSFIFN